MRCASEGQVVRIRDFPIRVLASSDRNIGFYLIDPDERSRYRPHSHDCNAGRNRGAKPTDRPEADNKQAWVEFHRGGKSDIHTGRYLAVAAQRSPAEHDQSSKKKRSVPDDRATPNPRVEKQHRDQQQ